MDHPHYYQIGGITIQLESDLPFTDRTFTPQIELFRVDKPGDDTVTIHHHFELPDLQRQDLGKEVYRKAPWAIYQQGDAWVYLGILPGDGDPALWKVATFNHDHTKAEIYNNGNKAWLSGNLNALTTFPSDQILIARLLADRNGCYLHSAGAILNGAGILFVGHSEAGKSTTTRILKKAGGKLYGQVPLQVEILCDDRNILRSQEDGWRVYGTWSHGDFPDVSPASAPLRLFCFIEKAEENTMTPLTDRKEITRRLLACVIKPLVTTDWWHKTLDLIEQMSSEVPCYVMRFEKSGGIVAALYRLISVERMALDNPQDS